MTRLSLILLAVLTASALSLVSSQHEARKLFGELELHAAAPVLDDAIDAQRQVEEPLPCAIDGEAEREVRATIRERAGGFALGLGDAALLEDLPQRAVGEPLEPHALAA